MIRVKFYLDADKRYKGFAIQGHAGYAAYGSDIVCAAVSALSTNTVNSLEAFSSDQIETRTEEERGRHIPAFSQKPGFGPGKHTQRVW